MPPVRVRLTGSANLTEFPVPDSWIGRDSVTHTKTYNISESDLDAVKRRVKQEDYTTKNPEREKEEMPFEDSFREQDWVRVGKKRGNYGEYWNPIKLDKYQDYKENNCIVPDDFISMKKVKSLFGAWATKEKVEKSGLDMKFGRKRGNCGRSGWFVTSEILKQRRSVSENDGVVPAGQIFNRFTNLSHQDLDEIVENNEEDIRPKKFRDGDNVYRKDLMVSIEPLLELNEERSNPRKQLRSRSVTSTDVVGNSQKLRKMLREKNAKNNLN